jgi:ABC-2 type transport system permease protein
MFYRIITLVVKELQMLLRDPQSRRILFIPALLQLALFPLASTLEVKNNTLAIYNQDGGAASFELAQRFSHAKAFSETLSIESEEAMRATIDQQKALVVVRFPPDFSRKLVAGVPVTIEAILDGRRSNGGQIAFSYIQSILQTYLDERDAAHSRVAPSTVLARHWFNPNLNFVWFVIPCLVAIITTIITMIITALSVAREREHGTLDQLLVSPLTPEMIMIGKAIPALLVATFQGTLIMTGGVLVYGVPFQGSLLLLYGSMFFYILALVGFGLLISSICATQQQAFLGVFSFVMPATLLSGYVSPIDNMPVVLQYITWMDPLRHFIIIVKGLFLKDMPAAMVLENLWPLLVIALVTSTLATLIFRRHVT